MADSTAVTGAAEKASGGLPQFDIAQWPGQMVWVLVIFAVLYFLIAKVFVPRVGGTIDSREDKISGDIGEAFRARNAAQADADAAAGEMTHARARAQKLASDARAEAKAAAVARGAEEDAKLAVTLNEAEARIAAARTEAMGHVRGIALDTAAAIIERLTGAPAFAGEIDSALASAAQEA